MFAGAIFGELGADDGAELSVAAEELSDGPWAAAVAIPKANADVNRTRRNVLCVKR